VSVSVSSSEGVLLMTVVDSGPGFSPEALDRAFEPFYTTKTRGSGLGLATALAAVREHGGTLSLANREQAVGAAAAVSIPLS